MQTFLTSQSFIETAHCLDQKRLVKQLLECRQIMAALTGNSKGGTNHPCTKMWAGHERSLYKYAYSMAVEMRNRGYKYEANLNAIKEMLFPIWKDINPNRPAWLTDPYIADKVFTTHRASLFNKDPEHYAQFQIDTYFARAQVCCIGTKKICNYYWPTHEGA